MKTAKEKLIEKLQNLEMRRLFHLRDSALGRRYVPESLLHQLKITPLIQ